MLFKTGQEFFEYAATIERVSREQEKELAARMKDGDEAAGARLVEQYLPYVASFLSRHSITSLASIYKCIAIVEAEVSKFDFQRERDYPSFVDHLRHHFMRVVTEHIIADTPL